MTININKEGTVAIIKSYYKKNGLDVDVTMRSSTGDDRFGGAFTLIEVTGKVNVCGLEQSFKERVNDRALFNIFSQELHDDGYEVTGVTCNTDITYKTIGSYMNERTEKVAAFKGIDVEVKNLVKQKSIQL